MHTHSPWHSALHHAVHRIIPPRAAVVRRRAAHLQRLLSSAAAHPAEAEGEMPTEQGSAQAAAGAAGAAAKMDEPEASRGGEASPPEQDDDEQNPSPGAAAAAAAALISCSRSGRGKCARYHCQEATRSHAPGVAASTGQHQEREPSNLGVARVTGLPSTATTSLASSLRAQSSSTSNAPVTHYAPSSIANDTLVMCRARADIAPRRHMPRDAHACTYNTLIMYCNNCMLPAVDAELEQRRLLARASG